MKTYTKEQRMELAKRFRRKVLFYKLKEKYLKKAEQERNQELKQSN